MFGTLTFGVVFFRWLRHKERLLTAAQAHPMVPSGLEARMEHVEQIVEAISLEVERIGEGQRFVTRLLGGRAESVDEHRDAHVLGPSDERIDS